MGAYDDSFGALLIAVVIAAVLYGFTCVQTWYYFAHYPSDPWYTKLLAAAVLVTDTSHQAIITHVVYTYLVTNFGVPSIRGTLVWSLTGEVFFNALTTLMVQCFLVMRIYKLSNKNWTLAGVASLLVIVQFVVSMIFASKAVYFTTYTQLATVSGLSKTINGTAAAGDIVIAVILCALLQRSRSDFERSNSIINKLIMFSINTGLMTSLFAFASLISISVWPHALIYASFYFCIGRLYCNSLLATLNARKILRGEALDDSMTLAFTSTQKMSSSRLQTRSEHVPNISIMVDTTRECAHDGQYSPTCDVKTPEVV